MKKKKIKELGLVIGIVNGGIAISERVDRKIKYLTEGVAEKAFVSILLFAGLTIYDNINVSQNLNSVSSVIG